MDKSYDAVNKQLWHVSNQNFSCEADAIKMITPILKKLKYHTVQYAVLPIEKYLVPGRPNPRTPKKTVGYRVEYTLASSIEKVTHCKQRLGRFILATNQSKEHLSDGDILRQYKEQSQVESGFKFIKNNTFELDSFFLNTPKRIEALMMIMTLCLMVYNFAQFNIRKSLEHFNDVLPDQHGKPTQKPTMKWLAEIMVVIAVVTINTPEYQQRIVTNVNQVHRKIIAYFGKKATEIYGLPPDYQQVSINYTNYKNFLDWCEM